MGHNCSLLSRQSCQARGGTAAALGTWLKRAQTSESTHTVDGVSHVRRTHTRLCILSVQLPSLLKLSTPPPTYLPPLPHCTPPQLPSLYPSLHPLPPLPHCTPPQLPSLYPTSLTAPLTTPLPFPPSLHPTPHLPSPSLHCGTPLLPSACSRSTGHCGWPPPASPPERCPRSIHEGRPGCGAHPPAVERRALQEKQLWRGLCGQ